MALVAADLQRCPRQFLPFWYVCATPRIKRWSLFPLPFSLGWPCDSLYPVECVRCDNVTSLTRSCNFHFHSLGMFLPLHTEAQPRPLLTEPPCEESGHIEENKESSQSLARSEAPVLCVGSFWILQAQLSHPSWYHVEQRWALLAEPCSNSWPTGQWAIQWLLL